MLVKFLPLSVSVLAFLHAAPSIVCAPILPARPCMAEVNYSFLYLSSHLKLLEYCRRSQRCLQSRKCIVNESVYVGDKNSTHCMFRWSTSESSRQYGIQTAIMRQGRGLLTKKSSQSDNKALCSIDRMLRRRLCTT